MLCLLSYAQQPPETEGNEVTLTEVDPAGTTSPHKAPPLLPQVFIDEEELSVNNDYSIYKVPIVNEEVNIIVEELDKVKSILIKDDINLLKFYRDRIKFLRKDIDEYRYAESIRYNRILNVLKEVHKDIPVVEPITGKEIPRLFEEEFEEARDLKDKVYKIISKKM